MSTTITCEPAGCTVWDGSPDQVAQLACCSVVVDNLEAIRTFPADFGATPSTIYVRGHTVPGDGGQGMFIVKSGNPPGTYEDDDVRVVLFPGGDGSQAAVRDIQDGEISTAMAGMPTDGTDASDAIELTLKAARIGSYSIDGGAEPSFGAVIQAWKVVISPGKSYISRPIELKAGDDIRWDTGAVTLPITLGMTLVQSQPGADNLTDYGSYSARCVRIRDPQLDGNGLASKGLFLDTIAAGSVIDAPRIYGITGQRWTGVTGTGTQGTAVLTVSDGSSMSPMDVVSITGEDDPHTIISVAGDTVVLDRNLTAGHTNDTVRHRALGIHCAMAQQSDVFGADVRFCDLALYLGVNIDEIDSTDMRFHGGMYGHSRGCVNIGSAVGSRFFGVTMQRASAESELRIWIGRGNTFHNCWYEPVAGYDENELIRQVPMIDISQRAYSTQFYSLRWTNNTNNAGWRRMLRNSGYGTVIHSVNTNLNELLPNPTDPNDYAWIEQGGQGYVTMYQESGETTNDWPWQFIIDDSGNHAPANSRSIIQRSGMERQAGIVAHYVEDEASAGIDDATRIYSQQDFDPSGDGSFSNIRLALRSNGVYIGDGTNAPMKIIGRRLVSYGDPTGTAARATFDTESVTLPELARRVSAIIKDLTAHGLWDQT